MSVIAKIQTEQARAAALRAAGAGLKPPLIARAAGIDIADLEGWLAAGERDLMPGGDALSDDAQFYLDYKEACGEPLVRSMETLKKAAEEDWRAAKAYIEMIAPEMATKPAVDLHLPVDLGSSKPDDEDDDGMSDADFFEAAEFVLRKRRKAPEATKDGSD